MNLSDVSDPVLTTPGKLRRGSESRRGKEAARFYPVTKEPGQKEGKKRKTSHSENPPVETHVGWIMDKRAARERLESVTESLGESPECGSLGSSAGKLAVKTAGCSRPETTRSLSVGPVNISSVVWGVKRRWSGRRGGRRISV